MFSIINGIKANLKSFDMSIESMCVLVYMQKLNNESEYIMNKQLLAQKIKILELSIKINKRQLEKYPDDNKLQFKIQAGFNDQSNCGSTFTSRFIG